MAVKRIPLAAFIVGGLCLAGAAVLAYFVHGGKTPAAPIPLTPEAKEYVHENHLQLSDVGIKATDSYMQQTIVEIQGKIRNTGDRPVQLVEIYCVFSDARGQTIFRPRVAIVNARMGGLKPGEVKPFRLPFDEIPHSWNQAMPRLVIAAVKFS
ncbi:MAG TPA: FxLYD domain-containing protein [Bryobacteraceae bacterium]|nr:FxLYD domain-containing protein [Bryobacteraceae bacterium]